MMTTCVEVPHTGGVSYAASAQSRGPATGSRVRIHLAAVEGDGAGCCGDRARLDLARRPPDVPLREGGSRAARPVRGVEHALGARGGNRARPARATGGELAVPQPADDREEGGHDRPDQQRALHPGNRRRLARAGVPGIRLSVRPPFQPLPRSVRGDPGAVRVRREHVQGRVLRHRRVAALPEAGAGRRAAADDRVVRREDAGADAAARADVERVEPGLWQQPRGTEEAPRPRRCDLRAGRARPGDAGEDDRAADSDEGWIRPRLGIWRTRRDRRNGYRATSGRAERICRDGYLACPARARPDHGGHDRRPATPAGTTGQMMTLDTQSLDAFLANWAK